MRRNPARRSPGRFATLLAVFGWLAQCWAPAAHALTARNHGPAASGYCAPRSTHLAAKLATLPADVRVLLEQVGASASNHTACAVACAATTPGAPPPAPIFPVVATSTHEGPVSTGLPRTATTTAPTPPARGPPA